MEKTAPAFLTEQKRALMTMGVQTGRWWYRPPNIIFLKIMYSELNLQLESPPLRERPSWSVELWFDCIIMMIQC